MAFTPEDKVLLERLIREGLAKQFVKQNLTPEQLESLVVKTINIALSGKVGGAQARLGHAGAAGGGRVEHVVKVALREVERASVPVTTTQATPVKSVKNPIDAFFDNQEKKVAKEIDRWSGASKRPQPVPTEQLPQNIQDIIARKVALDKGLSMAGTPQEIGKAKKATGYELTASLKKSGFVRVDELIYRKDEYEAYEKAAEASKPQQLDITKAPKQDASVPITPATPIVPPTPLQPKLTEVPIVPSQQAEPLPTTKTVEQEGKPLFNKAQDILKTIEKVFNDLGKTMTTEAQEGYSKLITNNKLSASAVMADPNIPSETFPAMHKAAVEAGYIPDDSKKDTFSYPSESGPQIVDRKTEMAARKRLEALAKMQATTKEILTKYGEVANKFNEIDPNLLTDPNRKVDIATKNGITTIKSFYKDAQGFPIGASAKVDSSGKMIYTGEEKKRIAELERRIVEFEKVQKLTEQVATEYPKASEQLKKYDPRFLTDPNRKMKTYTDASTGSTIVKSTFTEDTGVIRTATAVVDKYGDVINSATNRHASFIDGVKRDTREFIKWSLAIALVYTPLQKLQEMIQQSIKNQALLADVIVTLGESQEATNAIFESASQIAAETGEAISGVLEGYNLALRATGDIQDKTERYATANKLLADSIILAKLSTLNQAEATDTLVAALRQTNTPLDQGQVLMDKWVKVTKVANVDLATLATSFAIVGESASNAGLGIDELNGLIALVATSGITTAKETGNAVRALISGYSTDAVQKQLSAFGIAVKNSEGDARDFQDVMGDIRTMFQAGLISESQLNKIAMIIGGGNRRQAQVVTSIVNLDQMNRVASESATAHGEAQKALGIQLDTVQTKSVMLTNAFTQLAQSFGMQGGVLSGIAAMTDGLSWLVRLISDLVAGLGTASTALAVLGATSFITKGKSNTLQSLYGGIGSKLYGAGAAVTQLPNLALNSMIAGTAAGKMHYNDARETASLRGEQFGRNNATQISNTLTGVIGVGITAALRATKGDWEGAGAVAATGIAVGLATKSGTWATIGATIGSVIATYIENVTSKVGTQPIGQPKTEDDKTKTDEEKANNALIEAILSAAQSNTTRGAPVTRGGIEFSIAALKASQWLLGKTTRNANFDELNETETAIILAKLLKIPLEEITDVLQANAANIDTGTDSYSTEQIKKLVGEQGAIPAGLAQTTQKDLQAQLEEQFYDPSNNMSLAAYKRRSDALSGADAALVQWMETVKLAGIELDGFGLDLKTDADLVKVLGDVILNGNEEQIASFNETSSAIRDTINDIHEFQRLISIGTDIETNTKNLDEAQLKLEGLIQTLAKLPKLTTEQIQLQKATIPGLTRFDKIDTKEFDKIIAKAKELDKAYKATLETYELLKYEQENAETEQIFALQGGITKRQTGSYVNQISEAKTMLQDEGSIFDKLGIQSLGILPGQLGKLDEILKRITADAVAQGYEVDKETFIARFDDGQFLKMTEDQTLLQLALQELIDIESKQLEGIYNLPANGEFFVPFQARAIEPTGNLEELYKKLSGAQTTSETTPETSAAIKKRLEDESKYGLVEIESKSISAELAASIVTGINPLIGAMNSLESTLRNLTSSGKDDFPLPYKVDTVETNINNLEQSGWDAMIQGIQSWFGITNKPNYTFQDPFKIDTVTNPELDAQNQISTDMQNWENLMAERPTVRNQQADGKITIELPPLPGSNFAALITEALSSFSSGIIEKLFGGGLGAGTGTGVGTGLGLGTTNLFQDKMQNGAMGSTTTTPSTLQKLNLNITSNVNLRLDGRIVANVVKRYLGESLLRYNTSSGSASRSVIAS